MAGIGDDGAILHAFQVLSINDVDVARHSDKNITESSRLYAGKHTVAIHHCFQSAGRINFGHDHICAHTVGARGYTAATPAITEDNNGTTRQQYFFFNDAGTTEIYTLSLHDALPIRGIRLLPGGHARASRARSSPPG